VFLKHSADGGTTWGNEIQVSTKDDGPTYLRMTYMPDTGAAHKGRVVLTWTGTEPGTEDGFWTQFAFADPANYDAQASWQGSIVTINAKHGNNGGSAYNPKRTQVPLAVPSTGEFINVFETLDYTAKPSGNTNPVSVTNHVFVSSNGGTSWTEQNHYEVTGQYLFFPNAVVDNGGNVQVYFYARGGGAGGDDRDLYASIRKGASWSCGASTCKLIWDTPDSLMFPAADTTQEGAASNRVYVAVAKSATSEADKKFYIMYTDDDQATFSAQKGPFAGVVARGAYITGPVLDVDAGMEGTKWRTHVSYMEATNAWIQPQAAMTWSEDGFTTKTDQLITTNSLSKGHHASAVIGGKVFTTFFMRNPVDYNMDVYLVIHGTGGAPTPTGAIAGTVTDQASAPLQGVTVTAKNNTSGQTFTATTDAAGKYLIGNLLGGPYDVDVAKTGCTSPGKKTATVTPPGSTTADFQMNCAGGTPTGSITGKVTDQNGTALAAVTVTATNTTGSKSATTDAAGMYSISGLGGGSYDVDVARSGCNSPGKKTVTVTPPGSVTADFQMTCGVPPTKGNIKGKVTDAVTSSAIAGAQVDAQQGGTSKLKATTSSTGDYSLLNLDPGSYDLVFTKTGYVDKTENGVQVTAGADTTKDAALSPTSQPGKGTISGKVTDAADAKALSGAAVKALLSGATKGQATTKSDGTYTIAGLDPGTYDLEVTATGYDKKSESGVVVVADKTTTKDVQLSKAGTPVNPPSDPMGGLLIPLVLIIVIVVVVALVAIMMMKKKKQPAPPPMGGGPQWGPPQGGDQWGQPQQGYDQNQQWQQPPQGGQGGWG
jgi:hypothetical protein